MIVIVTLTIAAFCTVSGASLPPLVNLLNYGKIQGVYGATVNNRTFYSFEGVPYAEPPIGKNRFEKPEPVKPWNGVWQARTLYKCLQYSQLAGPGQDYVIEGDEDCLFLNIYTPVLEKNAMLDVVVYIHGGAFMFGYGGEFGPEYIMDKDLVYISLNYRLGPFGFLSTEDDVVPGNNGIRDQILALEWIKHNVQYFGGNPNSVSIAGVSAGGASVHIHYLTPKSRGLFCGGISQSGTALNPWVIMEKPLEKTKKISSKLGCPTEDNRQMIKCLKERPGRQIVALVKEFQPWLYNPFSPFGVVVDSWSSDPVLPDHPLSLIKNKRVSDLPWIVSKTNFEGIYPAADFIKNGTKNLEEIDKRWNELAPFILDYNYTVDPKLKNEVSQKIRKYYLDDKRVNRSSFIDFVQILSDRLFNIDIDKAAKLQSASVESSVYFYYFTYRPADSWHQHWIGRQDDFGAGHVEDTSLVFKMKDVEKYSNEEDKLMVKLFVELFASFAKTGKPEVPVSWIPLSKNNQELVIALKIASPTDLDMVKLNSSNSEFWESLPIKENEKW